MTANKVKNIINQQVKNLKSTFVDAKKIDWVNQYLSGNASAFAITCKAGTCDVTSKPMLSNLPTITQGDLIKLLRLCDFDDECFTSPKPVTLRTSTIMDEVRCTYVIIINLALGSGAEFVDFMAEEPVSGSVTVLIQKKYADDSVLGKAMDTTQTASKAVDAISTVASLLK
ncbi:hypothetical protein [Shewanella sp. YIC-542]|uniref:hypothetical protein n=1 Tax=Shewanella mytili TaxID=3377111 RepID=UPI00398E4087